MTAVELSNAPAIVPLLIMPGQPPLYVRREDEDDAAKLIVGHRAMLQEPSEPEVRRVLDLGAREGAFQMYARLRWPYAWCDSVEEDPELRRLCELNSLPGNRVLDGVPWAARYDLVRVTKGYEHVRVKLGTAHHPDDCFGQSIVFFDGIQPCVLEDSFVQVAGGMRAKGQPMSYWVR